MIFPFPAFKNIHSCDVYTPYRITNAAGEKVINPNRNQISSVLMDLKDPAHYKHGKAIQTFSRMFCAYVEQNKLMLQTPTSQLGVIIAIVPSSQQGQVSAALIDIATYTEKALKKKGCNITVVPNLFTRTKTIPKLHNGGDRSIGVHLNSISLNATNLINLRLSRIIILDDVSTTGGSLRACCQLLENQGIPSANIELVSLLKTATL